MLAVKAIFVWAFCVKQMQTAESEHTFTVVLDASQSCNMLQLRECECECEASAAQWVSLLEVF